MPGDEPPQPTEPFFLVIADHDRGVFSVEGPRIDDRPWHAATRHARDQYHRHVACCPAGPDRDVLAAEDQQTQKLRGPAWKHRMATSMNSSFICIEIPISPDVGNHGRTGEWDGGVSRSVEHAAVQRRDHGAWGDCATTEGRTLSEYQTLAST